MYIIGADKRVFCTIQWTLLPSDIYMSVSKKLSTHLALSILEHSWFQIIFVF